MRVSFRGIEEIRKNLTDGVRARHLARTWRLGGLGLIVLCLLVYIPGLWTIPPVDRDESRFAQASRQMLESGTLEGWVVPRVQDRPRLNKPPLIYWLQAGSAFVLGDAPGEWAWLDGGSENIWVYRVPSVLCAMLTVLLTWRVGLRMFDPRAAWLAAALLAVCPMVVWDAHQARADQLLLAMTTATMGCLWVVWRGGKARNLPQSHRVTEKEAGSESVSVPLRLGGEPSLRWALGFWVFAGLGVMTKGPITPMIAGLTVFSLCLVSRDWSLVRRLRPFVGIVIVAAIVGPWVVMVGNEVGWSKYLSIVYDETIGRSAGAKEGHWGPPGYHIVLLGVLFWPGSLLTAAAIGRAWRRGLRRNVTTESTVGHGEGAGGKGPLLRRVVPSGLRGLKSARPGRDAELFCLAWMLPAWIVFELVGTKLPHYTMPLYPAAALMSARLVFGVRAWFLPAMNSNQQGALLAFLSTRDVRCPRCKYNLRGLTCAHCPECRLDLRIENGKLRTGPRYDAGLRMGRLLWLVIGAVLGIGIPAYLVAWRVTFTRNPTDWQPATYAAILGLLSAVASAAFMLGAARSLRKDRYVQGSLIAVAVCVLSSGAILGALLPHEQRIWISKRMTDSLKQASYPLDVPCASIGYYEDSLVFLRRGRITPLEKFEDFVRWSAEKPHCVLFQYDDGRTQPSLTTPVYDSAARVSLRAVAVGFNYSTGKRVKILIWDIRR